MDITKLSKECLVKLIEEIKPLINHETMNAAIQKVMTTQNLVNELDGKRLNENDVEAKKQKRNKAFDMSRYRQRHIALHVIYDGTKYQGFADQQITKDTINNNYIERELFKALVKVRLIEDRSTCHYSRCGRTDAGVSAAGQVIALYLRSNLREGVEFVDEENQVNQNQKSLSLTEEIDYPCILNHVLPSDIRVDGWCPVSKTFDARFNCTSRTYRYFFVKRNLNIEKMNEACQYFIGEHDFRNICKMDIINVHNFVRTILNSHIITIREDPQDSSHSLMAFEIEGKGFLWHQVRCMMALLFFIGSEKEEPQLIANLLDIEKNPYKPLYMMADPNPLCLYECKYDKEECNFENSLSERARRELLQHFETLWSENSISMARLESSLTQLAQNTNALYGPTFFVPSCDYKYIYSNHQRILDRKKENSYDDKIKNLNGTSLKKLEEQIRKKPPETLAALPDAIKDKLNIQ